MKASIQADETVTNFFFFLLFGHTCQAASMQDLSSPTRDDPAPPAVEAQSLNYWNSREVQPVTNLKDNKEPVK